MLPMDAAPEAALAGGVSIVIAVVNQIDYTRQCLDSIRACTDLPYEIIIVDNGSQDGSAEFCAAVGCRVIRNEHNLGCARAWNQGIRTARAPLILIPNNDVVVSTGWLRVLAEFQQRTGAAEPGQPRRSQLGARQNDTRIDRCAGDHARRVLACYRDRLHEARHPRSRTRRNRWCTARDHGEPASRSDQRVLAVQHSRLWRRPGSLPAYAARAWLLDRGNSLGHKSLHIESLDTDTALRALCERDREVNLFCRRG
jgi:glycosyltransferase involved in cell wall biosynthesis